MTMSDVKTLERITNRKPIKHKPLWKYALELADCIDSSIQDAQANKILVKALIKFSADLRKAHSKLLRKHVHDSVNGRLNILDLMSQHIDPVIEVLFPVDSYEMDTLRTCGITIPIFEKIKSITDIQIMSDRLKFAAEPIAGHLETAPPENFDSIIDHLAVCNLLGEIVAHTYSVFSNHSIKWCKLCFRMASKSSSYCREHKPVEHNSEIDKAYRTGKIIRKVIVSKFEKKWASRRLERLSMGENFEMIEKNKLVNINDAKSSNAVVLDKIIIDFCESTLHGDWRVSSIRWDEFLDGNILIRQRFDQRAVNFDSWDEFRSALLKSLQNNFEFTHHPLWILRMLDEATDWFDSEDKYKPRPSLSSKKMIISMRKEFPDMSQTEIAKKTGVTRQRVSIVLKQHKTN